MHIQLQGIDFYKQPSTLYHRFFVGDIPWFTKINPDQSFGDFQLPGIDFINSLPVIHRPVLFGRHADDSSEALGEIIGIIETHTKGDILY